MTTHTPRSSAGEDDAPAAPGFLTVLTTTGNPERARDLAQGAVEARLAACAQISAPVTSVYRWQGEVATDQEWQVLFKTTARRYGALEAYLLAEHDYDTPEIIATPLLRGSAAYLAWLAAETSVPGAPDGPGAPEDLRAPGARDGGGTGAGAAPAR